MLAPVLLSLSLSLSLPLALGPEVPIGAAQLTNAALNQEVSGVASNGHDYLALWKDERGTSFHSLYVTRVDTAGHPLVPAGRRIAEASDGRLTWTGSAYLLVYTAGPRLNGQILDDDGNPSGTPTQLDLPGIPTEIASNGDTLLTVDLSGNVWLLAHDGIVIHKSFISTLTDLSPIFRTAGGDYAFVILQGQTIALEVVNPTNGAAQRVNLANTGGSVSHAAAAATGDGRILLTWNDLAGDQRVTHYALVDESGHTLVAPVAIDSTGADLGNYTSVSVSAGWDGREFLLTLGPKPLRAWRVTSSGQLVDPQAVVLADGPAPRQRFTTSASGVLTVWEGWNGYDCDADGRTAARFAELAAASTHVLSLSAAPQGTPRLASGATPLAVWRERRLAGGPVGGQEGVELAPASAHAYPAVAARGRTSYLTAWLSANRSGAMTVQAKRVSFDGIPVDAEPILLASEGNGNYLEFSSSAKQPSIAFDGTNFLVIWATLAGDLHGMHVAADGRPLDAQPIAITTPASHIGETISPRVVWSGSVYVVAWIDQPYPPAGISPPISFPARISVVRVAADGHVLDSSQMVIWREGAAGSLAIASSGNGLLAIWNGGSCVWGAALRSDGTPLGAARQLDCNRDYADVDLAWNGREFVAVWGDPAARTVNALRLDPAMNALDAAPFAVNPPETVASQPSVAASGSGATIGYIRLADEPQYGGVARAFARTLPLLAPLPRLRAVRF
jgi:hypothetical protein